MAVTSLPLAWRSAAELSLGMPGVGFYLRRQGAVPCLRARVTFGPSPKSDQKRRSHLRFENPPAPRTWGLAVLHPARMRQSVDHPKCGIDLLLSPLPLNVQNVELRSGAFQSKSGSAQRNTSFHISDEPEYGSKRRKEIQKPWVFGGVLSPISFAAERNGAAGGKKEIILPLLAKVGRAGARNLPAAPGGVEYPHSSV